MRSSKIAPWFSKLTHFTEQKNTYKGLHKKGGKSIYVKNV